MRPDASKKTLGRAVRGLVVLAGLGAAGRGGEAAATDSTGLVPLPELGPGLYAGQSGGLYPDGANSMPQAHRDAGLRLARQVQPLDPEGSPAADGKTVLLSIGMSSTTQHFRAFMDLARDEADLHPNLVLVDGAQGGQSADRTADPQASYWNAVEARLEAAGVTAAQVQAVWIKQAVPFPAEAFPAEAERLQGLLELNVQILAARFANLKVAYLSNHVYAGYAESRLNTEPHAYENGFAVKWLIADQIAGKAGLNYDAARGPLRAPWMAWGPYLWVDGLKPRSDGLVFAREDFAADGAHPSPSGERKVARMLLDFLLQEPTARPWLLQPAASTSVGAESWGRVKGGAGRAD